MGEIVNLRNFRKQKDRQDKERQAEVNRRAHGRSRGERTLQESERAKAERHIEGHKRGKDGKAGKAGKVDTTAEPETPPIVPEETGDEN